jgi:hypothetical protein
MLGFFKSKPATIQELRQKLFALLECGDMEAAKNPRFHGVTFADCFVALRSGDYRLNAQGDTQWLKRDKLFDATDWPLKKKKDFFDLQSGFRTDDILNIVTPLVYFVCKGNLKAAEHVLLQKLDANMTVDDPFAKSFRSPLFFAVNDLAMTELLVNYGEKITYNVVDAAAMALKGQTEEDLSVVAFLLQRGGNIDAVRRALSSCTDAKTSEKILNRLEGKPVASDAEPVVMPAQQEPETPLPETCVKYERKVDDLTVVEIYDFNDRERMTVLRKATATCRVRRCARALTRSAAIIAG